MIGNCDICDAANVPVSKGLAAGGIETVSCYPCCGDVPDPYGERGGELFYDGEDTDPIEELSQECGLDENGQCSLAGTEHCDFECPWRDSEDFAGSEAWKRKHEK